MSVRDRCGFRRVVAGAEYAALIRLVVWWRKGGLRHSVVVRRRTSIGRVGFGSGCGVGVVDADDDGGDVDVDVDMSSLP